MRDLFEKSDLHAWTEYTMAIIGDNVSGSGDVPKSNYSMLFFQIQEKDDYGDLLLYLSYDARDAKLSISVAKACNLRPMDITGASGKLGKIRFINYFGHDDSILHKKYSRWRDLLWQLLG